MKTINLKGGLGNQMFQYAYGRSLELAGKKIVFNTSFFYDKPSKDTARNFKLNKFNIKTKTEFKNKRENSIKKVMNKILIRLNLRDSDYHQSEKYFKNIKDVIYKEFTLKNPLSKKSQEWQEKISKTDNSISLHIRRGDYVQNKKTNAFHGTCDLEYYKKALEIMAGNIGNKNLEIFVFSDDINWAKENLHFNYATNFVSDSQIPDYEEMYLISLCKYNIIANSTFSWWGAWLNQNPAKIVIAPKQWFTNKTSDELGILPKTWLRI